MNLIQQLLRMKQLFLSFMLLMCVPAFSQVTPDKETDTMYRPFYGLRIFTENDFFSPLASNKDDNYTGGLKGDFITNQLQFLRFGNLFTKKKWNIVIQNISYGFTVFTPQDLANDKIVKTDRPYASYEFVSAGSSFFKRSTKKNIVGYEIFLGQIGSQTGKNFQTHIHENHWFGTTRPVPQGWRYQIANGGAIALHIKVFSEKNVFETNNLQNFRWLQCSWMNEINAGQYLINYAQSFRFNLFNVNRVFGESFSGIQYSGLPTVAPGGGKQKHFSFNFYIAPRVRLVAHNATLTGNLLSRGSDYSIPQKDLIPAILEYDMGLNIRWCFATVGASLNGRSREFTFQEEPAHNWGGVYVTIAFNTKK
jgi:hypothetical protein